MSYPPPAPRLGLDRRRRVAWLHVVLVALGGWIALTSLFAPAEPREAFQAAAGFAIVAIAGLYALQLPTEEIVPVGSGWRIGLLGLLCAGTALVEGVVWSDVVVGCLVTVLAAYVTYLTRWA